MNSTRPAESLAYELFVSAAPATATPTTPVSCTSPDLGLVVAGDVIYNGAHQYVGDALGPDGLAPWRAAIDNVEALAPQTIVAGHLNRLGDDDAVRQTAATRRYLDDAETALKTETTALGYFNHLIQLYPDHAGQLILWAGAGAQYGVREHPADDRAKIVAAAWL
jgi:hypothetical protein